MIDKFIFNNGLCSEFADTLLEKVKPFLPNAKLGVIRGKVKLSGYDIYGDTAWEDCHAVVIIDKKHYLDVDGLVKFKNKNNIYSFSNETLKIEMIGLDKIKREDYSIYNEYEDMPISIHATFLKVMDGIGLDLELINNGKKIAEEYIEENKSFFNKEFEKSLELVQKEKSHIIERF